MGWFLAIGLGLVCLFLAAEGRAQDTDPPQTQAGFYPSFATSDSDGSMIAVTGIDITGSSILYLVDTKSRQLAVYQAQGGTSSTMNVKFVGGRNIDLDLQVDGYNDKSEYSYKELQRRFSKLDQKSFSEEGK